MLWTLRQVKEGVFMSELEMSANNKTAFIVPIVYSMNALCSIQSSLYTLKIK